jgi:hypothetical protein
MKNIAAVPAATVTLDAKPGAGAVETFRCFEARHRRNPVDVLADEQLEIGGWFLAMHPWAVLDQLFAVVDGSDVYSLPYGNPRPDIDETQRDEALVNCGFATTFPVAGLDQGPHTMTFVGAAANAFVTLETSFVFHVLVEPAPAHGIATSAPLRGRIRSVRGTVVTGVRHDGRSSAAIEPNGALVIQGWCAGSTDGSIPDRVAIVLAGWGNDYRVPARRCREAEAGIVLGPTGTACGFHTMLDTSKIAPGLYRVITEVTVAGSTRSRVNDAWVEIMGDTSSWLPGLLPTYRHAPACTLDVALPDKILQYNSLVLGGSIENSEPVSGIYARFDGESSFTLTRTTSDASSTTSTTIVRFVGLLAMQLSLGRHLLEIVAMDRMCAGVWVAIRHEFEVIADLLDASAPSM